MYRKNYKVNCRVYCSSLNSGHLERHEGRNKGPKTLTGGFRPEVL